MRAFVMAAGYGKRLGALGEVVPKPLLPLGGVPLIGFALEKLAALGVRQAAVNLHHGADAIRSALGECAYGVEIRYFHEPDILGTAGGIKNAEAFLCEDEAPFFVLNADAPCGADLRAALAHHRRGDFLATLVLRHSPEVDRYGALEVDEAGRLRKFLDACAPGTPEGELQRAMFTGLSVMSPAMLRHVPAGVACDIALEVYPALMRSGARIGAILTDAYWMDAGTPARYLRANADVLAGAFVPDFAWPPAGYLLLEGPPVRWGEGSVCPPVLLGPNVVLHKNAQAGPFTTIMGGAILAENAVARETVVFPGGMVAADSVLEGCVVGPEAVAASQGARMSGEVFLRGGAREKMA